MFATVLLVAFAFGQAGPDKAITDAEKKEFLEVLAKLPSRGEFFTEEAVSKAVPYTRVLLALTEKDLGKGNLYPFLALSRGLIERKEARRYALTIIFSFFAPFASSLKKGSPIVQSLPKVGGLGVEIGGAL